MTEYKVARAARFEKITLDQALCSQKSTTFQAVASKACDGDTDTVSKTAHAQDIWFQIDFTSPTAFEKVKIFPGDETDELEFNLEWQAEDDGWYSCPGLPFAFAAQGESKDHACSTSGSKAKAVKIGSLWNVDRYLQLLEVEVYRYADIVVPAAAVHDYTFSGINVHGHGFGAVPHSVDVVACNLAG